MALRTALAGCLPDGDITYTRMNQLAGIDHKTVQIGDGTGMTPEQIDSVLKGLNIPHRKISHEPQLDLILPTEYQRELYGYIESGCACLVGFELAAASGSTQPATRHMIPVIGHTFNEDAWVPEAQRMYFGGDVGYLPSENWLSSYVIHDDNVGPYLCLPRHYLRQDNFRIIYGLQKEETVCSPSEAEAISLSYIIAIVKNPSYSSEVWLERLSLFAQFGSLVLRTQYVQRDEYLAHLESMVTWGGETLDTGTRERIAAVLPDHFWMTEASVPDLFSSSRRKLGEVLLDAKTVPSKPLNADLLLAARLPGFFFVREQGNLGIVQSPIKEHTELFSHGAQNS